MQNRYDFVYLFDIKDGNPNGDPDAGNLPRTDPETGQGLVTDVCLKRKVRNFVGLVKGEQPPFEIYVKEKAVLNRQHERAYVALDISRNPQEDKPAAQAEIPEGAKPKAKKAAKPGKSVEEARNLTKWMCDNFYDIRTFGAVMTTEVNCGQVRGPIQFAFARSVDPIVTLEHAVTRCAVTNERDLEKERTIGRKFTVPYALYRVHGFINPHLAEQTGFDANGEDLMLFIKALEQMFETDRSAARGEMSARRLILFKHASKLGNAPAHQLFGRVQVPAKEQNGQLNKQDNGAPRRFEDYQVTIDQTNLPEGITIEQPF
jgi:CRISPR-associated protein Csd2